MFPALLHIKKLKRMCSKPTYFISYYLGKLMVSLLQYLYLGGNCIEKGRRFFMCKFLVHQIHLKKIFAITAIF